MTDRNIDTPTLSYVAKVAKALGDIQGDVGYGVLSVDVDVLFDGTRIGIKIRPDEISETAYEMVVEND